MILKLTFPKRRKKQIMMTMTITKMMSCKGSMKIRLVKNLHLRQSMTLMSMIMKIVSIAGLKMG